MRLLAVGMCAAVLSAAAVNGVRFRGLAAVDRRTARVAGTRGTVLRTGDDGRTWQDVSPPGAVAPAVGPTGTDVTAGAGRSRRALDGGSFDTVACAAGGGCWAAGEKGRVGRLERLR